MTTDGYEAWLRAKPAPDLQDLVRQHGGYNKITAEAWAEYDRAMAEWQERRRNRSADVQSSEIPNSDRSDPASAACRASIGGRASTASTAIARFGAVRNTAIVGRTMPTAFRERQNEDADDRDSHDDDGSRHSDAGARGGCRSAGRLAEAMAMKHRGRLRTTESTGPNNDGEQSDVYKSLCRAASAENCRRLHRR